MGQETEEEEEVLDKKGKYPIGLGELRVLVLHREGGN